MAEIKIGDRTIGDGHPCYVIAEMGVNHNGSLQTAFRMVDKAVEAGAEAVKFQKRTIEDLWTNEKMVGPPDAQGFGVTFAAYWDRLEFDYDSWYRIRDYVRAAGVEFLVSAWDPVAVNDLEKMGVRAYKIASADIDNFPLLVHTAKKNKPMIVSTGMADTVMVDETVALLEKTGADYMLLQCTSTYPSQYSELDLLGIEYLKERYGVPVGYSGHEKGIHIPPVAVALGACVVERHMTLDRTMPGADQASSLEPSQFARVVRNIRDIEMAMGQCGKRMHESEKLFATNLRKSVVSRVDIGEGVEVTLQMLTVKGPGTGLSPARITELVGRKARRNIPADTTLIEGDFEQ